MFRYGFGIIIVLLAYLVTIKTSNSFGYEIALLLVIICHEYYVK